MSGDPFWRVRFAWLRLFCLLVPKQDRRALLFLTDYGLFGMLVCAWAKPFRWVIERVP
jgi:hypothetical protein